MKALSLWQPWASLMMTPAKRNETRSWATSYRGPLVICAAKGGLSKSDLIAEMSYWHMQSALGPLVGKPCKLPNGPTDEHPWRWNGVEWSLLPMGAALGIVELYDCVPTDKMTQEEIIIERHFGNYEIGRYAWKTRLIKVFDNPFPVKGKQGFFNVDIPEEVKA